MSDAQRRMVESVLRGGGSDPAAPLAGGACEATAEKLRGLGFAAADVDDAVAVAVAQEGRPTLEAALDWLCLSVPDEELPQAFQPGAGQTVAVLRSSSTHQQALQELGYSAEDAMAALQQCSGDEVAALQLLHGRLCGKLAADSSGDPAVWEEERVALAAIYDADVQFPAQQQCLISLDVHGTQLTLDFRIPRSYPGGAPVIGVRCPALQPHARLELTRLLHGLAAGLVGEAMVYELASAAPGLLPEAQRGHNLSLMVQPAPEVVALPAAAAAEAGAPPTATSRRQPVIDTAAESRRLQEERGRWLRGDGKMRAAREALPAHTRRDAFLEALGGHRVTVVSGATGCGKSTQLPQYILEQAVERGQGGACSILVTQPRRISAVGVAARVAAERGEALGGVVGYSVRLDARASRRTRLLFCTTGVLLRRLLGDPGLAGTTHVVVDEVHERSADSDLLLLLLRDLLGSSAGLRVVLMSATAEAGLFQRYFDAQLAPHGVGFHFVRASACWWASLYDKKMPAAGAERMRCGHHPGLHAPRR
jgi:ATP-dependent RNA helicase DHX57